MRGERYSESVERLFELYGYERVMRTWLESHGYRYIGDCRRNRERIRRRQVNWLSQLQSMSDYERTAMLEVLNQSSPG